MDALKCFHVSFSKVMKSCWNLYQRRSELLPSTSSNEVFICHQAQYHSSIVFSSSYYQAALHAGVVHSKTQNDLLLLMLEPICTIWSYLSWDSFIYTEENNRTFYRKNLLIVIVSFSSKLFCMESLHFKYQSRRHHMLPIH